MFIILGFMSIIDDDAETISQNGDYGTLGAQKGERVKQHGFYGSSPFTCDCGGIAVLFGAIC